MGSKSNTLEYTRCEGKSVRDKSKLSARERGQQKKISIKIKQPRWREKQADT